MARVGITKAREKRWAIIGEDGRHVWMGRKSDPSEDEIVVAEQTLDAKGLAGWLAIVEGDYWSKRGTTGFIMVRPLAAPSQGKGVEGSTRPANVLRRPGLARGRPCGLALFLWLVMQLSRLSLCGLEVTAAEPT